MTVAVDLVELKKINISAGVAFNNVMQCYDAAWVKLYYGKARIPAIYGVDYTVVLAFDFASFNITPAASLLEKIALAVESNEVYVVRQPPPIHDFSLNDAYVRSKIVDIMDRAYMAVQYAVYLSNRVAAKVDSNVYNSTNSLLGFDNEGNTVTYPLSEIVKGAYGATGTYAQRVDYNNNAMGFTFFAADKSPPVFYIHGALPGQWSGPNIVGFAKNNYTGVATSKAEIAASDPDIVERINYSVSYGSGFYDWTPGDYVAAATADPQQASVIPSTNPAYPANLGAYVIRKDRPRTPFQFDCRNGAAIDQTVKLNRFYEAGTNEKWEWVDQTGEFGVTGGIIAGNGAVAMKTPNWKGRLRLVTIVGGAPEIAARVANPKMFTLRNAPECSFEEFDFENALTTSYASRDTGFFTSMHVDNSSRVQTGGVKARGFTGYAYAQPSDPVGSTNCNFNRLRYLKTIDCGSGAANGAAGYALEANFSNRVDAGSASSTTQTTTFDVTTLPPLAFSSLNSVMIPLFARIKKRLYLITGIDRVLNRITILGWVDLRVTVGTLAYMFGGGILAMNGDSGLLKCEGADAVRTAIALTDASLYGSIIDRLQTQACGIAWLRGRLPSGACLGGGVAGYFENNECDVMNNSFGVGANIFGTMRGEHALDYDKVRTAVTPRDAANLLNPLYDIPSSITLSRRGKALIVEGAPRNSIDSGSSYTLDPNNRGVQPPTYRKAVQIVNLLNIEPSLNRVAGIDRFEFVSIGTAANGGAPTSVTVNLPPAFTVDFAASDVSDFLTPVGGVPPWIRTGTRVKVTTTNALPGGLAVATNYWAHVNEDETQLRLCTSSANAFTGINGVYIDLTTVGVGVHTLTSAPSLNGVEAPYVFDAANGRSLAGPTHFTGFWRVLENDYLIIPLSVSGLNGSVAMTGVSLSATLLAYAKAANIAAPAAAPGVYVPGANLAAPSVAYVQAELDAVITRLNAATAALLANNTSLIATKGEVATIVTRFNTAETGLQSVAQKQKRHDDALFAAGILKA